MVILQGKKGFTTPVREIDEQTDKIVVANVQPRTEE